MPLSPVSKAFLANILTIKNSVKFEHSEDCCVCQERCGTLSPDTGIMELEVQLPCNHTVGSACIATWLAENNTCPLCRYEFFPRQQLEHETIQDIGDEGSSSGPRMQGEDMEDFLARLTSNSESHDSPLAFALVYSQPLNLGLPVAFLALGIADTADSIAALRNSSAESIAAASVYIASHILNQPRSLTDVARLTELSERTIHNIYKALHRDRYELVDESWRQVVGGTTLGEAAEALPSLTWPPLRQDSTDPESEGEELTEGDYDREPSAIGGLNLVKELCFEFHADADSNPDTDPDNRVWRMAHNVADQMDTMEINWRNVNPWTIAAACTYMASHLVLQGKSVEEVALMSGIPPASISNTYQVMYRFREQIVREDWFGSFFWTMENALYSLPRL